MATRPWTGAVAAVAMLAATACTGGTSCDTLNALRQQRDQLRVEYADALQEQGGDPQSDALADLHDDLHALETQVFEMEQRCGR